MKNEYFEMAVSDRFGRAYALRNLRLPAIFNTTLLMLALTPLRVGGAGNWAGAIMFLGLLFLL